MHFGPDKHGKWRVILFGRKIWGDLERQGEEEYEQNQSQDCFLAMGAQSMTISDLSCEPQSLSPSQWTSFCHLPALSAMPLFQRGLPLLHSEGNPYQVVLENWESHFLGRLISPGVPKERGVWSSQGGRKDKLVFPLHSLGLYSNNESCLRTVSKKPSG